MRLKNLSSVVSKDAISYLHGSFLVGDATNLYGAMQSWLKSEKSNFAVTPNLAQFHHLSNMGSSYYSYAFSEAMATQLFRRHTAELRCVEAPINRPFPTIRRDLLQPGGHCRAIQTNLFVSFCVSI
jgi:hypothetical protein